MSASRYRFSVVVPTFNRPNQVRDCVASLAEMNYPLEQ